MKKGYPWPNVDPATGAPVAPYFRNRHLRMGEGTTRTSPPSKVQGPPDPDRVTPYLENAPSSALGGTYDAQTRSVGLDEPPTAAVINRPTYDLSCGDDMNFYQCLAKPDIREENFGAPTDHILFSKVLYLGMPGTQKTLGGPPPSDYSKTPRAFIELRQKDGVTPFLDSVTGDWLLAEDVQSAANVSFYDDLPDFMESFPFGSYGVVYQILSSGGPIPNDQIQFLGAFPSGCPAAPSNKPIGLFNYSLWERFLNSAGGDLEASFASCELWVAGPPDLAQVNRDLGPAPGGVAWLPGDIVYTSRFAYKPYIVTTATVPSSVAMVLHGTPWFGLDITDYFGARVLGMGRREPMVPAHMVREPSSATLYSFDEANALFRAYDGLLRGTTGFDFKGRSKDSTGDYDSYAGFLHRRQLDIQNAYTTFPPGTVVNYDRATGIATIPGAQFYASGAPLVTCLIQEHDLIELDGEGVFIVYKINSAVSATLKQLDGSIGGGVGVVADKATIFRPQLRTGALADDPGAPPTTFGGNVMCGDALFTGGSVQQCAALTLITGGAKRLVRGWDFPDDRRGLVFGETALQGVWDLFDDGGMRFGPRLPGPNYDQSWLWTTAYDFINNRHRFSAKLIEYVSGYGGNPWGTGDPSMRLLAASANLAPTVLERLTLRVNPSKGYKGLDEGGPMGHTVALLLGDPEVTVAGLGSPNYSGLRARESSSGSSLNAISMFVHRDGAPDSGDTLGGFAEDDLYAMLREIGAPLGTGAVHRFELTWDFAGPDRRIDYGWSNPRTFFHHIPLQCFKNLVYNEAVPTTDWRYAEADTVVSSFPPPWGSATPPLGYVFPPVGPDPANDMAFVFCGNFSGPVAVDFPISLPHGATITEIKIRYWIDRLDPGFPTVPPDAPANFALFKQVTTPPVARSVVGAWVTQQLVPNPIRGWQTITIPGGIVVDNENEIYWVRAVAAYDGGVVTPLQTQLIAGIRVEYTMQSFMPA